jgi:hypothetical protein
MNKQIYNFFGVSVLYTFLAIGSSGTAQAEVNFNINFGPPPVVLSAPPHVILMPRLGVYFVPDSGSDVFFYNGFWWSPRGDRWYRAKQYNGSWSVVLRNDVPRHLYSVPKNYRDVYKKERPINYGQWKKQNRDHEDNGRKRK